VYTLVTNRSKSRKCNNARTVETAEEEEEEEESFLTFLDVASNRHFFRFSFFPNPHTRKTVSKKFQNPTHKKKLYKKINRTMLSFTQSVSTTRPRVVKPSTKRGTKVALTPRAVIHENITSLIGDTPIVKINKLAPEGVDMYVKCEYFNPLSSVKDRLALAVIEDAEKSGKLKPGMTVVEATSGNTGKLSLSLLFSFLIGNRKFSSIGLLPF